MFALSNQIEWMRIHRLFTSPIGFLLKFAFWTTLLVCANTIALYASSRSEYAAVTFNKSMKFIKEDQRDGHRWLTQESYIKMIQNHDQFLPEFKRWRRLFADHSLDLAALVKSFPGSEGLNVDTLRQIFSHSQRETWNITGSKIFTPWINRWSGPWSNGKMQYHLWDSTCCVEGRWIQPVTISEVRFAELNRVEEMAESREADVAINVFSSRFGITGWVSKYQQKRVEMPHIGYRVNDTTLVWISQEKQPGKLFTPDNRWFVFLEIVDRSVQPKAYRIYGQPILMEETVFEEPGQRDKHFATYYAKHTGNS